MKESFTDKNGRSEDMALAIGAKKLHESRQFMYDATQEYHDSFKDKETGLYLKKHLELRNCPVCNKDNYRRIFVSDGGIYVKCNSCQMCYLNPVFTDEALSKFYNNNNTVQSEVVDNENDFYRRIYSKGLASIDNQVAPDEILDMGCSSGVFLDLAREKGWNTSGVELNRAEFSVAQRKGHNVFNQSLETINFPKKFNAISMWDVFEHIKDGHKYLGMMKGLLAPKGVLFMQVPNFLALAPRILQEKCKMFDGLEHVNLYSPKTIAQIAETNGFRVNHIESVISEIPIVANYLNYEDSYLGSVEHGRKILGLIDEETLHKNFLGYKLQIILSPI